VCKGNICRSPFAARLAQHLLSAHNLSDSRCASAGLRYQNAGVPRDAAEAARGFGVELGEHHPQLLTPELVANHEMIVVMEVRQVSAMAQSFPECRQRLVLLPLFRPPDRFGNGFARYNIADPYGRSPAEFAACYRQIDESLRGLLSSCWPTVDFSEAQIGEREQVEGRR
jgi:protein-tyrosine phosphatase